MNPINWGYKMENELQLRHWLAEQLSPPITIQWIEPGRYGSSIGAADCNVKCGLVLVSLELKIWETTKKGVKCKMRPVQRRWHHVSMRKGQRTAVLASVGNYIILVRGDHVPLRDYAIDKNSGVEDGELIFVSIFMDLDRYLFDESYGFWL
jgi:hypothetical protein